MAFINPYASGVTNTIDGIPYIWTSNFTNIFETVSYSSTIYNGGTAVAAGSGKIISGKPMVYMYGTYATGLGNYIYNSGSTTPSFASGCGVIVIGAPTSTAYIYGTNGTLIKTIANPGSNNYFGGVVAVGNNRIAISGAGYNSYVGQVFLYDVSGNYIKTINSPSGLTGTTFGNSVSIANGVICIGSLNNNIVCLYDLNGNLIKQLSVPIGASQFGSGVSIGSGRIVIGAQSGLTFFGGTSYGSAYVYDLNGNLIKTLYPPLSNLPFYGSRVSVGSGKIAVASLSGTTAGTVLLYDLDGNLIQFVTSPSSASGDYFGNGLAFYLGNFVVASNTGTYIYTTQQVITPYDAIELTYG